MVNKNEVSTLMLKESNYLGLKKRGDDEMEKETIDWNRIYYECNKHRGLIQDMSFEDYIKLNTKQEVIAESKSIRKVPLEEVIQDINNFGKKETKVIPQAFLEYTKPESRESYVLGRYSQVIYFCKGKHIHNDNMELGIISSHAPGIAGDGGYMSGVRRLVLGKERCTDDKDPEVWLKGALAYVEEGPSGKLHYEAIGDPAATTLLMIAIESSRNKTGKEYKKNKKRENERTK